jgi:hypothetical protein
MVDLNNDTYGDTRDWREDFVFVNINCHHIGDGDFEDLDISLI